MLYHQQQQHTLALKLMLRQRSLQYLGLLTVKLTSVFLFLCAVARSPVLSNNGENLTFHIPSVDSKGLVKVCVVLSDGSCHGSAKITYLSLPSCTNAVPSSSWIRYDGLFFFLFPILHYSLNCELI